MTKYRFDEIAINSTQKKKPTEEDKVYYIGLEHIDPGCFDVVRWGSDVAPTGDKLLMQKGDVLFGKRRAYQRKVAIAPFDGIFSAHGMVLRPNLKVIDANYFPFFISSDKFMDTAVRISVGGLSPTINWKDLARQEFELPSLDEQKVLAYKLWAAYRLKEAYKKLLVATDEIVKSQFIEMFGDTHMRSDHSRQWKEVVEIINGKDYKSIQVEDGGYPVYGTGGEMARASDYLSPANSILLGRKGTIDKPLLIREKYWNVDTAFGAVPDEKVLHYVYFYWHCKTIDFNVLNKGTTLPSTTKVDLLNLWIKIPSMEEQTRFGSIVEQADKSKFGDFKSQFIEMFGNPLSSKQKNELKRLGQCCIINPRRPNIALCDTDKVSFIPMPAVSEDGYLVDMADEEYGKVKKGFTYFENNDVLFAKITPCMENGKGAIAYGLTNGIGVGSTEFHVLRPINGISSPYWLLH